MIDSYFDHFMQYPFIYHGLCSFSFNTFIQYIGYQSLSLLLYPSSF